MNKLRKIFPKFLITLALIEALLALTTSSARLPVADPPAFPAPVVAEVSELTLYERCVEGTIVPAARLQAHARAESDERDDAVGDGGLSRSRFQLFEVYHDYRAAKWGEYSIDDPVQAGRIAALYIQECIYAFPGDEAMQITAYCFGIEGARRHGIDAEYVQRVREWI